MRQRGKSFDERESIKIQLLTTLLDGWFSRNIRIASVLLLGNVAAFVAITTTIRDQTSAPGVTTISEALWSFALGANIAAVALFLTWLRTEFYRNILERAVGENLVGNKFDELVGKLFIPTLRSAQIGATLLLSLLFFASALSFFSGLAFIHGVTDAVINCLAKGCR